MATQITALILDDDEDSTAFLKYQLLSSLPNIHIESRLEPDVAGDFDIYFIDNDFQGEQFAGQLAKRVRKSDQNALVIAFSAFLDAPTLKQLINSGCDGAFEKQNREEFGLLIDIVRKYIAARGKQAIQGKAKGLLGTIHSITDLLREWNLRLESHSQHLVNKKNSTSKDAA